MTYTASPHDVSTAADADATGTGMSTNSAGYGAANGLSLADQHETAASAWSYVQLLSVCHGNCAQALVLFDLVQFHAAKGATALRVVSASELVRLYPCTAKLSVTASLWNARSLARAVGDLEYRKLIDVIPSVRNTAKQYRLNTDYLSFMVGNVDLSWLSGPIGEVV